MDSPPPWLFGKEFLPAKAIPGEWLLNAYLRDTTH